MAFAMLVYWSRPTVAADVEITSARDLAQSTPQSRMETVPENLAIGAC